VEPGERVTTEHDEIDHHAVWRWLHDESYWARGRPWDVQRRAVAASRCFAVVGPDGDTRACCRLVTDGATFGWLADVVVLPPYRGRGLGKELVAAVARGQDELRIRRVLLSTDNAQGLYAQVGFEPADAPFMDRVVAY
jgi:N-acetylglutamate synthase-like GNAT family acetyltransferase